MSHNAENDPPCEHDECYWSDGSESVPGDEGICCDCGASRPIPPGERTCGCPTDRHYRSCRVATPGMFRDEHTRPIPPGELIGTCGDGSRCQTPRECVAARACTRREEEQES